MSVRVADRGKSLTQYLEESRRLAVKVGKITANGPRKYRASHGDHLNKCALDAYMHCQVAQGIWVRKGPNAERNYEQRTSHLVEARGLVRHVAAAVKLYFDLVKDCDGYSAEKATRSMHSVGDMCSRLDALIDGILKWDAENIRRIRKSENV